MAAREGFEPSQTESESAVLPLHNSAIFILTIILYTIFPNCQDKFSKNDLPEVVLKEFVGHTKLQVFMGALLGIGIALLMH